MLRFVSLSLVLFQVLFMDLYVPAHTRGLITLGPAGEDVPSCCAPRPAAHPRSGDHHAPTSEDRSHCAVGYLASMYVPVEPFVIVLSPQEAVRLAHDRGVAQVRSVDQPTGFWPLGPPRAAA